VSSTVRYHGTASAVPAHPQLLRPAGAATTTKRQSACAGARTGAGDARCCSLRRPHSDAASPDAAAAAFKSRPVNLLSPHTPPAVLPQLC
jgi:hypothetical protein